MGNLHGYAVHLCCWLALHHSPLLRNGKHQLTFPELQWLTTKRTG